MVAMEVESSDEEYLVNRAKEELKRDPHAARAWMLTAKSLFPNNFSVQAWFFPAQIFFLALII